MRRFILAAAFCCLFAANSGAAAPKPLTLPAVIAEVQANNPELKSLLAAVEGAKGGVNTAKTWDNPELTVESGARRALADTSFETGFNGVLSLSQPIKFPGKRTLEIAIAQRDVQLREIAVDAFRFQMAAKVRRAFHRMLAAQKIIEARAEQVAAAKVFAESAAKRAEGGYAGDFETIKSEADVIAARSALLEAQGQLAASRIALNTLLARPHAAPLTLAGSLEGLTPHGETKDFVALALARNPALRALDVEAEKAGLRVERTRMDRLPDVAVGPSVEYYKDEQIYAVGASLALPFWDQKKGAIQTATAFQRQTLAEIRRLRVEIGGGVAAAAADLESACDQLALYPASFLDRLRAFVKQADEGYAQNATTLLIRLDARRTYFDTLTAYYAVLGRLAESRAELESAVGVPLDLKP